MNSNSIGVFVGLDYHDAGVQVCVMDRAGRMLMNRRCPNDWRAIVEIVHCLAPESDVHAAIEACTGAANLADELVSRGGWLMDLAHPGYVARMKQGPDKHDWGDSRILADLVRVGYLPRVWLAPQEIRELRRLVRYRQQLVHESTNVKLRIRSILRDHRLQGPGRAWTQSWLDWVERTQDLPSESRWIMDRHLEEMKRLKSALAVA
ncbi:MAG: transposase, partial [Phycisphaerae bacterium]|nr:transposase [Phycisphaerae bacterium]